MCVCAELEQPALTDEHCPQPCSSPQSVFHSHPQPLGNVWGRSGTRPPGRSRKKALVTSVIGSISMKILHKFVLCLAKKYRKTTILVAFSPPAHNQSAEVAILDGNHKFGS